MQQKHVNQWRSDDVKVTFNGNNFGVVWTNKSKITQNSEKHFLKSNVNLSKKLNLKHAVQKEKAELHAQTKAKTNKKRRENYKKRPQKEKEQHATYLKHMGHDKLPQLHHQS